jgi:hypothetical protein
VRAVRNGAGEVADGDDQCRFALRTM